MFEPFFEGKPKDFRVFHESFGLPILSFSFSLLIFVLGTWLPCRVLRQHVIWLI